MNRKEKRRAARTFSNLTLDLYDSEGQAIIGEGRFVNVSLAGSLLVTRQPLQVRQHIRLQVQSPADKPFEFAGQVVWRKKKAPNYTYGIQFEPFQNAPLLAHASTRAFASAR